MTLEHSHDIIIMQAEGFVDPFRIALKMIYLTFTQKKTSKNVRRDVEIHSLQFFSIILVCKHTGIFTELERNFIESA